MNMHKSLVAVLGLILISSTASAATCRAGSAAQAGSNRGSVGISAITPAKRFLPDGNHLFSVRSCS